MPRVALFADTFFEANGVGTLSRQLVEFARIQAFPFLLIRGGKQTRLSRDGSLEILELKRSAVSFPVDKTLYFDPLLMRHRHFVIEHILRFKPDLIHITGPGDMGFLGLRLAHVLGIPLVASWHTNLHEYLSRRLYRVLNLMPQELRTRTSCAVERETLRGLMRFYRVAQFVVAPNQTLVDLLHGRTGKPAYLMLALEWTQSRYRLHGTRQSERSGDRPFCIGYVGRLTTEKNVQMLVEIEQKLMAAGERNYDFLVVGEGGQQKWLRRKLQRAGRFRECCAAMIWRRLTGGWTLWFSLRGRTRSG